MAGSPNSGKSALFNALTGSRQKVGNYPGVTVERKVGRLQANPESRLDEILLIDLPGVYSLNAQSADESVTVAILHNKDQPQIDKADAILAIIDATNMERGISFVLELLDLKLPLMVALNMFDLAQKRHLKIDIERLSKELGVKIVPCVAIDQRSLEPLRLELEALAQKAQFQNAQALNVDKPSISTRSITPTTPAIDPVLRRKHKAKLIAEKVVLHPLSPHLWTKRLDRILLNPWFGIPILSAILILMFQAVFSWAETPMDAIEGGISILSDLMAQTLPEGLLLSFINDGVLAGVGAVVVFLPQILILFFFIYLLESTGYMMRAAYLMNRMMSLAGLQGQSFVPLLSSYACAIPGMMAARTVKNPKERILTILIAPLMTCSARLPVYVLIIGAFIPNIEVLGGLKLQGLVMFSLFLAGVVSAFVSAWVFKQTLLKAPRSAFLVELPTYKWPQPKHLFMNLVMRAKIFLKRAGGYILLVSVILWFLSSFPRAPVGQSQLPYSFAGRLGELIEPLVKPIGFDSRIAIALIPGFAAREVLVSAMATVFAVEESSGTPAQPSSEPPSESKPSEASLQQDSPMTSETSVEDQLAEKLITHYGLATALSLLAWYVYAPQCLATFAVMRRETNSWKWPAIGFSYLLVAAYLAAWVVYRTTLAVTSV